MNEGLAASHATANRKTNVWVLFPNYLEGRVAMEKISCVPPERMLDWIAAAVLTDVIKKLEIAQASRPNS